VGYGLLVAQQNQREDEDGAGHTSRSSGLLHVEVSQARVSQFTSKLAEARRQVMHVALSWRSREDQVEDGWINAMGYVRLCYPCFAVFFVLGYRGNLVFYLGL
jgi:hypothetical protein